VYMTVRRLSCYMNIPKYSKLFIQIVRETSCPGKWLSGKRPLPDRWSVSVYCVSNFIAVDITVGDAEDCKVGHLQTTHKLTDGRLHLMCYMFYK